MRLTGSGAYVRPTPTPKMPPGLIELMEGLTRDVLKNNPDDIYEFCAGHMQKLLDIRDGAVPKKQMTLEEKIKRAQEKIRQRIKERQLQYHKEIPELSNEALEEKKHDTELKNQAAIHTPVEIASSSKQPVHHGDAFIKTNEVEIFHEPDVVITTTDICEDDVLNKQKEVEESLPFNTGATENNILIKAVDEDMKNSSVDNEPDITITPDTIQSAELTDKVTKKAEELQGDIEVGIPATLDAVQNETSTNYVKEKLSENMVEIQPATSDILHNEESQKKQKEKTDDNDSEPSSEIKGTIYKPENANHLSAINTDSISEETQNTELFKNSDVTSKPSDSILDNTTVESKNVENAIVIDDNDNISEETQNKDLINSEETSKPLDSILDNTTAESKIFEKVVTDGNEGISEETQDEYLSKKTEKTSTPPNSILENTIVESKNVVKAVLIDGNEGISEETQNEYLPKNSEKTLTPPSSILENTTVESKNVEKAVGVNENHVKNEHEENDIIPIQEIKESLASKKLSPDIGNNVTQFDKAIEEHVIDVEKNRDVSKCIENNTLSIENNSNNDDQLVLNKSQKEVEKNSDESVLQSLLENLASGENQSNDNDPESLTEATTPIRHLKGTESLPIATHLENREHSIDNVDADNHLNNTVNLTDEKHHISAHLFQNENNIIHNNASGRKNDTIMESDEPTENAEGSGMDLETAAITIQKVFRTFLFSKSRTSTLDDTVNENSLDEEVEKKNFQDEPEYIISSANLNKERRTLGISRMDTMLQTVNEEKSLSLSTDDSSTLSSAATTIQAHVRGFLVRNRLTSYKTASNSSLVNSEGPSTSLDGDTNEPKKTILNIHIVPERGQFMSRDESMLTSIDLPLDNSPPSSINLHPLGYDKSEPRKQLKREDAIQSISPPSNNSGKLSEEVDSVKDSLELKPDDNATNSLTTNDKRQDVDTESCDTTLTISSTADTVVDAETYNARDVLSSPEHHSETDIKNEESVTNLSSDEMDVVTPFPTVTEKSAQETDSDEKPKLVHSGEFHDIVVQTQVKRSESSVVREFTNVLVYFLLWDKT